MKHPNITKGHRGNDGAPHDDLGVRTSEGTGGHGRARCECGGLSDTMPSREKRLNWHRWHREELAGMPWTR